MRYPKWCDTDFWLDQGYERYLELLCSCGSGQFRADCLDENLAHRWQVEVDVHHAQAAVEQFRKDHDENLPPGASVWARLLPEGETPADPDGFQTSFDPERAAQEYEEMQRRHGLIE